MKVSTSRPVGWMTLVLLAVTLSLVERPARGDETPAPTAPAKKFLRRKGHRLPHYYAAVVSEKQREEIYKIQDQYQPKIEALEAQLKAMKKERDEKIAAVLTPAQKKQIEEAAKAKKVEKADATPKKHDPTPKKHQEA